VAQLRDQLETIRKRGAELVVVGNGSAAFAAAFAEDFDLDAPLLIDPELRAYRAAGLRRGRVEVLSPRLPRNALRALLRGYRQTGVQGDPWQLGGVFVIRPDGSLAYRHTSREAGDHPPVEDVLAALAPGAPAVAEQERSAPWLRLLGEGLSRLVDPAVVLSFSQPGFQLHALAFDPEDLQVDLAGRRCAVTGANSGIGFETALALAELGADVVLLCRSEERGQEAAARIGERTGSRRVSVERCDVSDLASVRAAAARLRPGGLDVLVHNAGLLPASRLASPQDLELCLATHVVGPYVLTTQLLPALERSRDARVVWVSSGGMYTRRLQLEDPNWERRAAAYDGVVAYAETKRAQVVLSGLFAERLAGGSVRVNAMHPGWAETPGVARSIPGFFRATRAILRTPAQGADTVVWLAASPAGGEVSGRFFFDRRPRRTHWLPFTQETDRERAKLWDLCEELGARA
jgi:dehydrogenase/reductase SDR family member 12